MKNANEKTGRADSNVELIGLINLMLAKIEARSGDDTTEIERAYDAVLEVYRGGRKEPAPAKEKAQTSAEQIEDAEIVVIPWELRNLPREEIARRVGIGGAAK